MKDKKYYLENIEQYRNENGTYTSPINGKVVKSVKGIRSHFGLIGISWPRRSISYIKCVYCDKEMSNTVIKRHELACYLNPENLNHCAVCGKVLKNYKQKTCGSSCANIHFRSGENNGNWKGIQPHDYRRICFKYHEKKCIYCGESKIVAVHHNDHNRNNNNPENLIPLCPTHHQYIHSRYVNEVQPTVNEYIEKWKNNFYLDKK